MRDGLRAEHVVRTGDQQRQQDETRRLAGLGGAVPLLHVLDRGALGRVLLGRAGERWGGS